MAKNKNHKESHDNGDNLHKNVRIIIDKATETTANDYDSLFAVTEESVTVKALCERHKQAKIILSHLDALMKFTETYFETPEDCVDEEYKDNLIHTARDNLQEKPENHEKD